MVLRIGHRGACGYEPENTLASFSKAVELGLDMVELDCHVCKTGELVVIHDENVERTTNGTGLVSELSLSELKSLDADKNQKIPLLSEVFDLIDRKLKINIELKGLGTAIPVNSLIEKYVKEKRWKYDDFLISSFNPNELITFSDINPRVKIGFLSLEIVEGIIQLCEGIYAYSIHICYKHITKEFIDDIHRRKMKVFVWTLNEKSVIENMKGLGVDGLFSDYPDLI